MARQMGRGRCVGCRVRVLGESERGAAAAGGFADGQPRQPPIFASVDADVFSRGPRAREGGRCERTPRAQRSVNRERRHVADAADAADTGRAGAPASRRRVTWHTNGGRRGGNAQGRWMKTCRSPPRQHAPRHRAHLGARGRGALTTSDTVAAEVRATGGGGTSTGGTRAGRGHCTLPQLLADRARHLQPGTQALLASALQRPNDAHAAARTARPGPWLPARSHPAPGGLYGNRGPPTACGCISISEFVQPTALCSCETVFCSSVSLQPTRRCRYCRRRHCHCRCCCRWRCQCPWPTPQRHWP